MIVCDERDTRTGGGGEREKEGGGEAKGVKIRMPCGEQDVNYANPFVGTRSVGRLANVPVGVTIQCHLMACP